MFVRAILFIIGLFIGVSGFYTNNKNHNNYRDNLNVGLILPHTNFGIREYTRAINNAVSGLHRSKSQRLTWLKQFNFSTKNVHQYYLTLTPSPTGDCCYSLYGVWLFITYYHTSYPYPLKFIVPCYILINFCSPIHSKERNKIFSICLMLLNIFSMKFVIRSLLKIVKELEQTP